jgi:hypothetical protein
VTLLQVGSEGRSTSVRLLVGSEDEGGGGGKRGVEGQSTSARGQVEDTRNEEGDNEREDAIDLQDLAHVAHNGREANGQPGQKHTQDLAPPPLCVCVYVCVCACARLCVCVIFSSAPALVRAAVCAISTWDPRLTMLALPATCPLANPVALIPYTVSPSITRYHEVSRGITRYHEVSRVIQSGGFAGCQAAPALASLN